MKNYYRILDLPEHATLAQIKWQYKQLVRVYHPDRFKDPTDKSFAENKLKEIIEAYRVLSSRDGQASNTHVADVDGSPDDPSMHPPRPIVSHSFLDFGTLNRGDRETITIQIGNMGGIAQQLHFVLSEPSEWFAISEQKQLYQDKLLPIEVEVTVDSTNLEIGKVYDGWIDVNLDNTTTRVNLAAQIAAKKWRFSFPVRLAMFLGLLLAISSLAGFLTTSIFSTGGSSNESDRSWAAEMVTITHPEPYITFSAHEGNVHTIFATQISGDRQFKLSQVGEEPAWSPQRQQVAYIEYDDKGNTQLFVTEIHNLYPSSHDQPLVGAPIVTPPVQLTDSSEKKSAPSWSPNGRRIAYITHPSADPINQTGSLVTIDLESRQEIPLTEAKDGNVTNFSWGANSDSILTVLYKNKANELKVIDVDAGTIEPLAARDAFIGIEENGGVWLPDDSGVLLTSEQGVFLLDLKSETSRSIVDRSSRDPQISPETNMVAFLSPEENTNSEDENLWIMQLDGQNLAQITESGCLSYAWSPDGAYIAFTTGNLQSDTPTLYLWVMKIGEEPKVIAEVNNPIIAWLY